MAALSTVQHPSFLEKVIFDVIFELAFFWSLELLKHAFLSTRGPTDVELFPILKFVKSE